MKRNLILIAIFLLNSMVVFAQLPKVNKKQIEEAIKEIRNEFNIESALAVSIVDPTQTLYQEVFGYADLANKKKASEESLYYIASVTKPMVATLTLILEQEGILSIDDPIKKYLPEGFEFKDPKLSSEWITIRDLLTHRTGIDNRMLEMQTSYIGLTNKEKLMKYYEFSRSNGARNHRYSNLNYILLGVVLEKATGKDWKTLINEKLFEPVGMGSTITNFDIENYDQLAKPHKLNFSGGLKTRTVDEMYVQSNTLYPSGGVISTIGDLNKFMKFLLNSANGKSEMLSKNTVDAAWSNQANMRPSPYYNFYGYGLGWEIADYEGVTLVTHGGSNGIGYKAFIALIPELNIGIALMANQNVEEQITQPILTKALVSRLLNKQDNLSDDIEKGKENLKSRIQMIKMRNTEPDYEASLPLEGLKVSADKLIGTYINPMLGEIQVSVKDKFLFFEFGNLKNRGVLVEGDKFKVDFSFATATITFKNGEKPELLIEEIGAAFQKNK